MSDTASNSGENWEQPERITIRGIWTGTITIPINLERLTERRRNLIANRGRFPVNTTGSSELSPFG